MNDPKLYQGENGPSSYPSKPKVSMDDLYNIVSLLSDQSLYSTIANRLKNGHPIVSSIHPQYREIVLIMSQMPQTYLNPVTRLQLPPPPPPHPLNRDLIYPVQELVLLSLLPMI